MISIGGFVKNSFVDWPEKITSVIFLNECPFRCPYCHSFSLLNKKIVLDKEEILDFLNKRKQDLDGIVISGGEPLTDIGIIPFIEELKQFNLPIKIDTNGNYPDLLQELINNNLIDYIAMDIKAPLKKYHDVCGVSVNTEKISKSIKIIMESNIDYEFRSTLTPVFHEEKDILTMSKLIKDSKIWYWQQISPHDTLSENFPKLRFTVDRLWQIKSMAEKNVKKITVR